MENRAAVFTSSPHDVELFRAGRWEGGSMLGWRHERDGSCRAWVRPAGADDAVWIDLSDVRLPEPLPLRGAEDTLTVVPPIQTAARRRRSGDAAEDAAASETTATMNLVAVRDGADVRNAPRAGARAGGRRRAPETEESGAAGYWAALDATGGRAVEPVSAPGRHRAPAAGVAGAGRHRAADTEVMPAVVTDGASPVEGDQAVSATVVGLPGGAVYDEPDLYTRPLRLATALPQPRIGR
jgi:hypothetical protein